VSRPGPVTVRAALLAVLLALGLALAVPAVAMAGPAPGPTPTPTPGQAGTTTATPTPTGRQPSIRATLQSGGKPVPGVRFEVSRDGTKVAEATTGADGRILVRLPAPGAYRLTLIESSLPAGLTVEGGGTRDLQVRTGLPRSVIFRLTGGASDDRGGTPNETLQLMVDGIKLGLVIAMSAIGLSLIYGTTGLTNFAHGELVTFGALAAWYLNVGNGGLGITLILAGLVAVALGGVFGAVNDLGLWRPLRRRGTGLIAMLVVSIGLSLLLRSLYQLIYGGRTRPYDDYQVQAAYDLGPVQIAPKDLASVVLSVLVLIGVAFVLQRTRFGKAMRAVADNGALASSSGINTQRIILYVWIAGGTLAALGGVLYGLTEGVNFQMGFQLLLLMFAGVTLGGLGTAYGALLGSLVVGVFIQLSTLVVPLELKNLGALIVLILILLVRPQGLLGRRERIG
jgi:neutral amino acid transport system permease protein